MNKTRPSASSLLAKPAVASERTIKRAFNPGRKLSPAAQVRLEQLSHLPDEKIDYSDAPALPSDFLKTAVRNPYFRPVKQQITLRLDADVIAWLRQSGKGYQTRLNDILRKEMRRELVASLNAAEDTRQPTPAKVQGRRTSLSAVSQRSTGTRKKAG